MTMDDADLMAVRRQLPAFGIDDGGGTLIALPPRNWHGDRLFRFEHADSGRDDRFYLIRLIDQQRVYRSSPLLKLTDDMLRAQLQACRYFRQRGLPYMEQVPPVAPTSSWAHVELGGRNCRMLMFKWVAGSHVEQIRAQHAAQIGEVLGRSHAAAEDMPAGHPYPPCHDYELHAQWVADARAALTGNIFAAKTTLPGYLQTCEEKVEFLRRHLHQRRIVVHGDFNLPNVIWSQDQRLCAVVDFDQTGWSRAVEDLSWVVKWYGLHSDQSLALDSMIELVSRYMEHRPLTEDEWLCLPALLWLNNGINYNFVLKLTQGLVSAHPGAVEKLQQMELYYRNRSERMHGLGQQLVRHFEH